MSETSTITLNKKSLSNNIRFLKRKLGQKVKISSVVKANAYGHGIELMVPLLIEEGVDHFSVFDFKEAKRVHKAATVEVDIMVMGWVSNGDIAEAIDKKISFYIFHLHRLKKALFYAKRLGKKARIHLEVESGMNRSGLNMDELCEAINLIKKNEEHFEISGFCTHLAGAESISNHLRIQKQIKRYNRMLKLLQSHELEPQYRHIANSAAAFVYPKTRMDLVRVGIMQYGFWSSAETFIHYISNKKSKMDPLDRILGWESQIMSIKEVKTGEFIGYGVSYLAQTDIKTALIPVGYSLGYSRSLSNKGRLIIRGQRCSVIGVVNMNMVIADISNIADAEIGDKVVIIGKQGDLEIKVSAFSNNVDMLNYEILAHLPSNIKRKVICPG